MTVLTSGNDRRVSAAKRFLEERTGGLSPDLPETLLLLPVPSFKDGKVTGTEETPDTLPVTGAAVAGYDIPAEIRALFLARGAAVFDVAGDEAYLAENARLTAIGTLAYLFAGETRAPEDLSVGIVGYGRIGRELLRLLTVYGARVRVYTGNAETRLTLGGLGVSVGDSGAPDFSGTDILINTAPAPLIRKENLPRPRPRVLELASGENIGEGVLYERLSSVPARFYPDSAGEAYARAVLRQILPREEKA